MYFNIVGVFGCETMVKPLFRIEKEGLIIEEKYVRSILSPSRIYGVSYAVNPYMGCSHGCVYCYARFTFISAGMNPLDWGRIVFPKINAPSLLKREVRSKKKGLVLLSSVTDPYQFIEEKYQLTRRCLEVLSRYEWPVTILTKSNLVLRDLDMIGKSKDIEVGLTITIVDDDVAEVFEPRAPRYSARVFALRELSKKTGNTYAFYGPLIPVLCEKDIEYVLSDLADIGINSILFDKLNIKAKNWISINMAIDQLGIDRREFWGKVRSPIFWNRIKRKVQEVSEKLRLHVVFCY